MINELKKLIRSTKNELISYSDYMSTVLYMPDKGYYMNKKMKVGKDGDFYTSINVHSVFAKVFAKVFVRMLEKYEIQPHICEIGGGTGQFAKTIIEEIKSLSKEVYSNLHYVMIEASPFHRELQSKLFSSEEPVFFFENLEEARKKYPTWNGIIFSNELIDAFPVHVVQEKDGCIYEVMVGLNGNDELHEVLQCCENERILKWLEEYGLQLNQNQRIEIPLAMNEWLEKISKWVKKGIIITVDYGYSKEEWSTPEHRNGSLRGYYQHQLIENPLLHPGDMDLTTHIHFDALTIFGERLGLKLLANTLQSEFLLQAGMLDFIQSNASNDPFSEEQKLNRAIRSFVFNNSMGTSFRVIIQEKGINSCKAEDFLSTKEDIFKNLPSF